MSFVAPPPPDGHGFTITVDDPQVVLNGDGTRLRGKVRKVARHTQVARLERAPFGRSARRVRLNRDGKLVATGRIEGRTLRLTLPKAARVSKRLRGTYVLRVVGGTRHVAVRLG